MELGIFLKYNPQKVWNIFIGKISYASNPALSLNHALSTSKISPTRNQPISLKLPF